MSRITRDDLATMHGERTLFAIHHRLDGYMPPVQLVKVKTARAKDAKVLRRSPTTHPWPMSAEPARVEYYADGVEAATRRDALLVEWLVGRFNTLTDKAAAEGIPRDRLLEILGISGGAQ